MSTNGTTVSRGYGREHVAQRRMWIQHIARYGPVPCVCQGHCGKHARQCAVMITKDTPFDLGHTDDRTAWTAPSVLVAIGQQAPSHATDGRS